MQPLKYRLAWQPICRLCLNDCRLGNRARYGFTTITNSKEESFSLLVTRWYAYTAPKCLLGLLPLVNHLFCDWLSSWTMTQVIPPATSVWTSCHLCVPLLPGRHGFIGGKGGDHLQWQSLLCLQICSLTSQGEQDFEENEKTAKGSPDDQVQMDLVGRSDLQFQYKK